MQQVKLQACLYDIPLCPLHNTQAVNSHGSVMHTYLSIENPLHSASPDPPVYMLQNEAFFPHDYPDTLAYAQLAAELAAEQTARISLRPKGRCSEGTPHPPPWDLLGASVPMTAKSSVSPMEAALVPAAPEEEATGSLVDQPEQQVDASAEEAQRGLLEESGVLTPSTMEEPAAMVIEGPAACHSINDGQGHAKIQHDSAPAPMFVARSGHTVQRCLQCNSRGQAGDQPSLQRASTVDPEAAVRPAEGAEREGSTGADARCMVRISLQTVGPGVLHEGAAILSLSPEEAASIRHSMLGHKLRSQVLAPRIPFLFNATMLCHTARARSTR